MGVTFGPGMVRALEERLAGVTAERDRLRDAIEAIPRHEHHAVVVMRRGQVRQKCNACYMTPWPCPTERAHIAAAATHQGNPSSVGSGCDGDHGAGTPDPAAAGRPSGRPAPEDCPPGTCPSCDNDRETTAEEET